jgi:hypothetical protein
MNNTLLKSEIRSIQPGWIGSLGLCLITMECGLELIMAQYRNNDISNAVAYVYFATGVALGETHREPTELMDMHLVPVEEALRIGREDEISERAERTGTAVVRAAVAIVRQGLLVSCYLHTSDTASSAQSDQESRWARQSDS